MALIGTISGSNGTSQTAITGTLVIANTTLNFPSIASDAVLFVSGAVGGDSKAVIGGDLVVSGTLTGVTGSFFSVTARTLLGSTGNPNLTLDLTGGKVTVAGDLEVDGNDILASDGQTNISLTSNTLTTFAGDIRVGGDDIQASDGTTAISLAAATGNVTLPGDLAVNGGDITTSAGTFNLVNATATTVNLGGGASAVNIGAAGSATTFVGNVTGSRFTSNAAGSLAIGGGQVYLNGASSNRIDFSSQGTGNPAFDAPTAGTKVVLYPAAGASATDYALGISPATLWQSIPSTDTAMMFKWFGGTTTLAALSGSGNMEISGDLAVNGGDITTSAGTFNLVNATATTVNIAGGATSAVNVGNASGTTTMSGFVTCSSDLAVNGSNISTTSATVNMFTGARSLTFNLGSTSDISTITIGRSGNASSTNIATGNNTTGGATKTVNIGTNTGPSATANINIGSSGSLGRTTLNNDVALTTGNLIGAPGAGANVLTLISSGNLIAKLDTDNNSPGHRFEVWDYLNAAKFAVGENGNAEIAGALLITGSSLSTATTTTFNLLTTALTGTLNVSSLANSINIGGSITTSSFTGDIAVAGRTSIATVVERLVNSNGGTGTVTFDVTSQGIFYVNGPTGNITADFVAVPISNNRVITPTVILSQSATPRIVNAVSVNSVAQTINWANNVVPSGTANKQDVFGFSLIRSGSAWKVLGQMSTYG